MSASHSDQLLPGARLRTAREGRGLSQDDVAARLHMSVTYVRAIDSDDYERLPETAFVKGYMRNYARLVGVPADEVANLFQQMVDEERAHGGADEVAEAMPQSSPGRLRHVLVVLAIALVLVLGWWLSLPEGGGQAPAQSGDTVTVTDAPGDAGEADVPMDAPQEDSVALPVIEEAAPAELEPEAASAPAELYSFDELVITFSADCWLEVLDASGEIAFSGQRNASRPLELEGLGPFRITFGDGSAVASLTFNGERVTLPSVAPGNVVRVSAP